MAKSSKQFLTPEAWTDFRERYESSDDRSCAILCASYVDDCLDVMIRNALMGNKDAIDGLLSDMMPLSSFSAKINIAFCLNLVHDTVYEDLHRIRKIRNAFAHRVADLTFGTDPVRSWCLDMVFPEDYLAPEEISHLGNDQRQYFILTCAMFSWFFEGHYFERAGRLKTMMLDLDHVEIEPPL
jgi:hypothetical protein